MIKTRTWVMFALLLLVDGIVIAQNQPQSRSLRDPLVTRYIGGGYALDGKLHLVANGDYLNLTLDQRREVIEQVANVFPNYDIQMHLGEQKRELWIATEDDFLYFGLWDNDSLQLDDYNRLELNRQGRTKFFCYVGGAMSGTRKNGDGSLSIRGGSYLFKDILDASATLNVGYTITGRKVQFASDISLASRVYWPLQIKSIRLAPNIGAGISWIMAPKKYFEFQILAGTSWFVGSGSVDLGMQYGIKRGFSLSIGYTFNIAAN